MRHSRKLTEELTETKKRIQSIFELTFLVGGAGRDIREGEEVCHTYGELSDAELLQTYGFVEELPPGVVNPNNRAALFVDDIVAACTQVRTRVGGAPEGGKGERRIACACRRAHA